MRGSATYMRFRVLLLALLAGWFVLVVSPVALAGPREYTAFVGGEYSFAGTRQQIDEVGAGIAHRLRLAHDASDPTSSTYVESGWYDSGDIDLGVAATKWITSVVATGSVPTSTTITITYSLDGKPMAPLPETPAPVKARTVRFLVSFATQVRDASPVLDRLAVSFYLQAPPHWTPPKPSKGGGGKLGPKKGSSSGNGSGSGSGTGTGSGAGSGAGGGSGGGSGGPGSSGSQRGNGQGAPPAGQGPPTPSGGAGGAATGGDGSVRGIVLSETGGGIGSKGADQKRAESSKRSRAFGIAGLGLLYIAGLASPAVRSQAWMSDPEIWMRGIRHAIGALLTKFKSEA